MGLLQPRLEFNRLAVKGNGLVEVPLAADDHAEVNVGRGVVRLEAHGLPAEGGRFVQPPEFRQGHGEVNAGGGPVGRGELSLLGESIYSGVEALLVGLLPKPVSAE